MDAATILAIFAIIISLVNSVFLGIQKLIGRCNKSKCCCIEFEQKIRDPISPVKEAVEVAKEKISSFREQAERHPSIADNSEIQHAVANLQASLAGLEEFRAQFRSATPSNVA